MSTLRRTGAVLVLALSILIIQEPTFGASKPVLGADPAVVRALNSGDGIGARIRIKELAAGGMDSMTYKWVEQQLLRRPDLGDDLLVLTLGKAAGAVDRLGDSDAQAELELADSAMLAKRFAEAAQGYRNVLGGGSPSELGPTTTHYIRLALARALYAQKKFEEAYAEARKIPASFARFRHVLFFRMWAAFRAGRVEAALGELANQRSLYFGPYMEPESYLIMTYLLKRLCRDSEAAEIMGQVEQFLEDLKSGKMGYEDWARLEVGTQYYLALEKSIDSPGADVRREAQRERERSSISRLLQSSFERKKKQWLEELPRVLAYSRLAITPETGGALKPIEKIEGREKLMSRGYEIWPNDDGEHWLDELGNQRYLGDTRCASR